MNKSTLNLLWLRPHTTLAVTLLIGLISSCVTNKKTTYLQEYKKSEYSTEYQPPEEYRIQVNDNLFVRVVTPDPRWSAMFNTLPTNTATMSVGEQAVDLLSYPVSIAGTVDIPYLGSIEVVGKTLEETKQMIEASLADYVSDAGVTVKLVNNYISILGEVNLPGRYPIYKEHMNIFQAIAMASDLDDYANRYKVKIVREASGGTIIKEFDLTDKNIIDTEFYYVMPNDVIYVQPMAGKFFSMNQFPFAIILTSITTFILLLNYLQD
jgi:polysaccharide export outer membrane protein